jgi:hypothetical protein
MYRNGTCGIASTSRCSQVLQDVQHSGITM